MPDEDKNKAGDDKGGDDKNRTLSADEIEAIAKKAKAALEAEDDKGGDDKNKKDDDDKGGDDDDFKIDPKNIDTDKTLKYIDKLKDENARRRIANKKSEEKLTKLETQLKEATDALNAAAAKIKEADSKTAAEAAKDASELEKATKKIEELTGKITELEETNAKNQAELTKTNKRVLVQDRENMITRLVQQQEVAFASDFERDGLIKTLTDMDDEGFTKNDEEVIYAVMKFTKDKKANEDKSTPGPGPGGRKTTTPIGEEVKALLAKKSMTTEERARLDELLAMTGQG